MLIVISSCVSLAVYPRKQLPTYRFGIASAVSLMVLCYTCPVKSKKKKTRKKRKKERKKERMTHRFGDRQLLRWDITFMFVKFAFVEPRLCLNVFFLCQLQLLYRVLSDPLLSCIFQLSCLIFVVCVFVPMIAITRSAAPCHREILAREYYKNARATARPFGVARLSECVCV